ncbi:MAG: hypothetical protein ACKO4W_06310 [Bacteroidota bacterium]
MSKKINQELEELSPLLRQLREQGDGLETPHDYFEKFDNHLKQRIAERGVRRHALQQIQAPVKRRMWPGVLAAAASLALILGAVWYFNTGNEPRELAVTELSPEEITAYLIENAADFEPEQLAALEETATVYNRLDSPEARKVMPEKEEIPAEAVEEIIDEMTDEELAELL